MKVVHRRVSFMEGTRLKAKRENTVKGTIYQGANLIYILWGNVAKQWGSAKKSGTRSSITIRWLFSTKSGMARKSK